MNSGFPSPEEFEEFLRKINMQQNDSDAWNDLPPSFAPLKSIFESLQGAMANSGSGTELPIDWTQTEKTANQLISATEGNHHPAGQEFQDADRIARSWLSQATHFRVASELSVVIERASWPSVSLASLKVIASPIAERSSADAMDSFRKLMPGQPDEFYQMVSGRLAGVAANLQGVQLGHLLAALANGVLIGSEFSFQPQQQPTLILENSREFAESISGPAIDSIIYLATRELLNVALFDTNPWIRESLLTQVVRYANHLTFNSAGMQEIQQAIENSDFESLGDLMVTMVNVEPSQEQTESRIAIQHLVALITGWADFRVLQACSHLSNLAAIDEAYRRRRATSSPISKAFKLLLNIDFEAAQTRAAADFWRAVSATLSARQVDELWVHPDLMPTESEIANPKHLLERLANTTEDEMDAALRKLLSGDQQ